MEGSASWGAAGLPVLVVHCCPVLCLSQGRCGFGCVRGATRGSALLPAVSPVAASHWAACSWCRAWACSAVEPGWGYYYCCVRGASAVPLEEAVSQPHGEEKGRLHGRGVSGWLLSLTVLLEAGASCGVWGLIVLSP